MIGCAAATLAVALVLLALYGRTLLPGLDLGDTASFQALVTAPTLTPRDAYPLYFLVGRAFVVSGEAFMEPARALNWMSAVFGALACATLVPLARRLSGSVTAAMFAALLFGASYTFWSQAVIAEVYTLAMFFVAASIGTAVWWADRPSLPRLALFFAVYAVSFGNHLSMILLLPGLAGLVVASHPGGWREAFRTRVWVLAAGMAALGALPYGWNLANLAASPDAPDSLAETAAAFWFDVTKSDWRSSMIGQVPEDRLAERFAMYRFDLGQQFGAVGILLAAAGFLSVARASWRLAMTLGVIYLVAASFALTYNVGDTHVFFLPSHLVLALLTAPGLVAVVRLFRIRARPLLLAAALAYPAARAADAFPALDRSRDTRAADLARQALEGVDGYREILLLDVGWQLFNGLAYVRAHDRPDLATAPLVPLLPTLPELLDANREAGRRVVVMPSSAVELVRSAYGDLDPATPDERFRRPTLLEVAQSARPGTLYVLTHFRSGAAPIDRDALRAASAALGAGDFPDARFNVAIGRVGSAPLARRSSDRPFRLRLEGGPVPLAVRVESWLPFDTIRRAGFGHVTSGRRHVFTLELGVSLVLLREDGTVGATHYEGGAYELPQRFLLDAR